MKNSENIKGKGFDANPQNINKSGRPRKLPDLDALLIEILEEEINSQVAIKAILIGLRKKAISGDVRAAELILDRAYGKIKMRQELSGPDGQPLYPPDSELAKLARERMRLLAAEAAED